MPPKLYWTTDVCLLRNVFTLSTFVVVYHLSSHPFQSILASGVTRFLLMLLWFAVECSPLPDVSRWLASLVGLEKPYSKWKGHYSARGYHKIPAARKKGGLDEAKGGKDK
mmetsp:Transcript_22815/g.57700  ORF Transcript_22815/g.57700 Transcript_22815/m.57700 type:complete len:110 (-) Transcript_22815:186-515(-)